ncbi:MAG: transcriptional regulator [Candidatus Omnitrophica bacterium]|nr:hypothetical protein [bacterium]NUN98359.1 transcriptional regulator [Candidatus Omnitrophota bacterium]
MSETPTGLDRVIHEPARLRLLMVLSGVDEADFKFLLSALGMTKGNLSSHVDRLAQAGYVQVLKGFNGKVTRTCYRLTERGREAIAEYWRELDAIRSMRGK